MPQIVANPLAIDDHFAYTPPMSQRKATSTTFDFRCWLQTQFSERTRKNPQYSLRAFARLLNMEPSSVSQILSGKRKASTKVLTQICDRLAVRPEIRKAILETSIRSKLSENDSEQIEYRQIAVDTFAVIADWYHYGILELTFVEDFESDVNWIAGRLGIRPTEARIAIERLLRVGLLEEHNGRWIKSDFFITNYKDGLTSGALKELQRQLVSRALKAIDECPQEDKDITSMTMSIDVGKLPEARKKIQKFRRDLCSFLETGKRTRVYSLNVQLFPISKTNE